MLWRGGKTEGWLMGRVWEMICGWRVEVVWRKVMDVKLKVKGRWKGCVKTTGMGRGVDAGGRVGDAYFTMLGRKS